MEWYYAKDKVQLGPVSQQKLTSLFETGEISRSTLVWRAGMAGWQPYEQALPNVVPQLLPDGQNGLPCSSCGGLFAEGDLLKFEGNLICPKCKPTVFQRFKETGSVSLGKIWRSDKILVLTREADLPDFCVKCNAPAHGQRLKRKLFWHTPLLYILVLFNVLIYAVVATLAGKKAYIQIGLCEQHRKKRWIYMACGWGSFIVGILSMVLGRSTEHWGVFFIGLVILTIGGIFGIRLSAMVSTKKITPEYLFVKGVCPEFLDRFPEWPGGE